MRNLTDICQNSRCNKPYTNDGIGRKRLYCCDACKQQAHRDARHPAGMARRKSRASIDLDSFERLIVSVWLESGPAAALMMDYAQARAIPINYQWIEKEFDRQSAAKDKDRRDFDNFMEWVNGATVS
jgi:hypothetical protein